MLSHESANKVDVGEQTHRYFLKELAALIRVPEARVTDLSYLKKYFAKEIGVGRPREEAMTRITTLFSQRAPLVIRKETDRNEIAVSYKGPTTSIEAVFIFKFDLHGGYSDMTMGVVTFGRE